jgi:F0F1-type ATP synthase assembly protein I
VNQTDPKQPSDQGENDPLEKKPWMKFAGLGMELAGSTLGLAAVGYLVDRQRGKADGYGVAVGVLIGFSFGMFRLIKQAMREVQNQSK